MFSGALFVGTIIATAIFGNGLLADDKAQSKPEPNVAETYVLPMGNQFTRGIVNIATGWGEIPRQIVVAGQEDGAALAFPVGFPTGIFMTVARTFYGAMETAFFVVPFNDNYTSALKPAYVWQKRPEVKKEAAKDQKAQ
jgi:putative exosortase-associated protein (TIGR04073 family)